MLDDVTKKMFEASTITDEAVVLDYVNAAAHQEEGQANNIKVGERVLQAKNLIAGH